jgi:hypothetical protein
LETAETDSLLPLPRDDVLVLASPTVVVRGDPGPWGLAVVGLKGVSRMGGGRAMCVTSGATDLAIAITLAGSGTGSLDCVDSVMSVCSVHSLLPLE